MITKTFTVIVLLLLSIQTQSQQWSYAFNCSSRSITYMNNFLTTQKTSVADANGGSVFHFTGTLQMRLLKTSAKGRLFAAAIRPLIYETSNAATGNTYQSDTNFLTRPFYFNISEGSITDLQVHKKMSDQVATSIKPLLSQFQFFIAGDALTSQTVVQDDPAGHCETSYLLIKRSAGQDSLFKKKLAYVSYSDEINTNRLKTTYLPSGDSRMVINHDSHLPAFIDGTEKITTQLSDKTIGILDNIYHFSLLSDADQSSQQHLLKPSLPDKSLYRLMPLYSFINSHDFDLIVRKGMLGNDNINSIIAKLKRPVKPADEDSLYLKIKSVATVYPATAVRLTAILDTAKPGTLVYNHLYRALIATENKASVNALSLLIWKHRQDWNYSKKILSNLGLSGVITDTMINIYKKIAALKTDARMSKTAQMAIGTMVDNLSATDQTAGRQLWNWLQADLAAMPFDAPASRQKILVWGNTNNKTAFDSVIKYLDHTDEEIRSVATMATGQFSTPEKVPVLLKLIKNDTLMSIKNSAATSIDNSVMNKADLVLLTDLIRGEKDSVMKSLLVNAINPATAEKTFVREALLQIDQQEDNLTVKANIAALLKRLEEFGMAPGN